MVLMHSWEHPEIPSLHSSMSVGDSIDVNIKYLYIILPEQNLSLLNLKPDWQEQLKNGTVLIQICSQPPLSVSHSLISEI